VGAVGLPEPAAAGWSGTGELGEAGYQEPLGQAGEEQGDGQAVFGDLVGAAVRDAFDDLVGAQPAQVVADLAAGHVLWRLPKLGGEVVPQARLVKSAGPSARAQQAPRRAWTRGSGIASRGCGCPPAALAAVQDVLDGTAPVIGYVTVVEAHLPAEELSPGELRVLRYLPTNLSRPEIADQLSVSANTVGIDLRSVYAKPGVRDRSSAVQRTRELRAAGGRSAALARLTGSR
jgi:LuxR family maltose regulon positive regulatory protein